MFNNTKPEQENLKNNVSDASKNVSDASRNISDAAKDAKKAKNNTYSIVKKEGDQFLDNARDKAQEVGKNVQQFVRNSSEKLKEGQERATETIRSRPLTSAGALFAAGLIIGAALKARRKVYVPSDLR